MNVVINGAAHDVADDSTVAGIVATLAKSDQGVAVAVNDQVVPKTAWAGVVLADGDRVEILTAVQGG